MAHGKASLETGEAGSRILPPDLVLLLDRKDVEDVSCWRQSETDPCFRLGVGEPMCDGSEVGPEPSKLLGWLPMPPITLSSVKIKNSYNRTGCTQQILFVLIEMEHDRRIRGCIATNSNYYDYQGGGT